MDFNFKKCEIMHFSTPSAPKQKFDYKLKGEILEIVSHHPYLGVDFSDNLKNDHIGLNIFYFMIIYNMDIHT